MHIALVGPELEENLSLRYLRGALEAEGHNVTQVDFEAPRDIERAAREIVASGAAIAGFSMVFTRRAEEFASLIARCRDVGFRGLTIAGGHFAAFHAEKLLGDLPALDVIAIGEGERILCELARDPTALDRIHGLVVRDGDAVRRNPPAMPEQDLDKLPWPTHRRPFDRYHGLPIVNMLSSRGCTHACGFCSIAAWHKLCGGARYRTRSAGNIAGEMACMYREGVRLFNFHDDNFLGRNRDENIARAVSLCDALRSQQVGKIGFQIKARPDAIDPELFALLRSMGLFRVFLGIEAGTEDSLRHLGRGQKLADNEQALETLNGLDLHVAFNLLVLNPESTFDDFAGNVAFLRAHPANPMNFCRTEIYEGTPLQRRLRKQDRLIGDYWGLDYEIGDARAQRAFDLFRAAFYDRNFGAHPLHYLSSQVDYEHQIRMDFFGTTPEVKKLAKSFVRAVNDNTVSYLEEVLAEVRAGRDRDEAFSRELAVRVAADDVRLHAEGQTILTRIRDIPETRAKKRSSRANAAIAASVALALAGCPRRPDTAPMEAAPPPPQPTSGGPPNNPTDDYSQQQQQQQQTDAGALPTAADVQMPPQPMEAAPPPPHPMEAAPNWRRGPR